MSRHEGWITKQGGRVQNWKRRWGILENGQLNYYKGPQDKKPQGGLNVRGMHCYEAKSLSKKYPFCFQIVTVERLWVICLDTKEEMPIWRQKLINNGAIWDSFDAPETEIQADGTVQITNTGATMMFARQIKLQVEKEPGKESGGAKQAYNHIPKIDPSLVHSGGEAKPYNYSYDSANSSAANSSYQSHYPNNPPSNSNPNTEQGQGQYNSQQNGFANNKPSGSSPGNTSNQLKNFGPSSSTPNGSTTTNTYNPNPNVTFNPNPNPTYNVNPNQNYNPNPNPNQPQPPYNPNPSPSPNASPTVSTKSSNPAPNPSSLSTSPYLQSNQMSEPISYHNSNTTGTASNTTTTTKEAPPIIPPKPDMTRNPSLTVSTDNTRGNTLPKVINVEPKRVAYEPASEDYSTVKLKLKDKDFFFPDFSRDQAINLLRQSGINCFLIRSSSIPGNYALSKYNATSNVCEHFIIEFVEHLSGFIIKDSNDFNCYESLLQLAKMSTEIAGFTPIGRVPGVALPEYQDMNNILTAYQQNKSQTPPNPSPLAQGQLQPQPQPQPQPPVKPQAVEPVVEEPNSYLSHVLHEPTPAPVKMVNPTPPPPVNPPPVKTSPSNGQLPNGGMPRKDNPNFGSNGTLPTKKELQMTMPPNVNRPLSPTQTTPPNVNRPLSPTLQPSNSGNNGSPPNTIRPAPSGTISAKQTKMVLPMKQPSPPVPIPNTGTTPRASNPNPSTTNTTPSPTSQPYMSNPTPVPQPNPNGFKLPPGAKAVFFPIAQPTSGSPINSGGARKLPPPPGAKPTKSAVSPPPGPSPNPPSINNGFGAHNNGAPLKPPVKNTNAPVAQPLKQIPEEYIQLPPTNENQVKAVIDNGYHSFLFEEITEQEDLVLKNPLYKDKPENPNLQYSNGPLPGTSPNQYNGKLDNSASYSNNTNPPNFVTKMDPSTPGTTKSISATVVFKGSVVKVFLYPNLTVEENLDQLLTFFADVDPSILYGVYVPEITSFLNPLQKVATYSKLKDGCEIEIRPKGKKSNFVETQGGGDSNTIDPNGLMFKVIIVGANSGVQSVTLNMRFNPYDTTVKEVLGRIQRKYSVDNPHDFGLMKDGEWLDPTLKLAAYNLNENQVLLYRYRKAF